jgi:hypothetical protein
MKPILFQNFNKCTIKSLETYENDEELYHRLIVGYNPMWKYGLPSGELTVDNNDAVYPLMPSLKENVPSSFGSYGNIVSAADPITQSGKGDFYVVTSKGRVLGLNQNGVVTGADYGYFTGSAINNNNAVDITVFNGKIVVIYPLGGSSFYKNEDNSGSWSVFGSFSTPRIVGTFANWLYVADTDTALGTRRYIKIFDTSFNPLNPAFDLGVGNVVVDFRNINNQYIAVVGQSVSFNSENKVYIWEGLPGVSFIKEIPFLGQYKGLTKVGNSWFLVSTLYNDLYIYELSGLTLLLKKVLYGIRPFFNQFIFRSAITSIGNNLVIPVSVDGYYLLFFNPFEDELFMDKVSSNTVFQYGIKKAIQTNDYLVLFSGTEGEMRWKLTGGLGATSPSAYFSSSLTGSYVSNWINFHQTITIRKIEVYYDGKPDAGGSIAVSLDTKNEELYADFATSSIGSVTNSDSKHRKVFSVGKSCSKFRLKLTITHGGTDNWSGAVKKVIVWYQ